MKALVIIISAYMIVTLIIMQRIVLGSRTRHIDIKYFALCEWIERDYIHLERIDTSVNMADHLTKTLS